MSTDYYFKKWKNTLVCLQNIIDLDVDYQTTKAHDKKLWEATERLSGVLARYIVVYNDTLDCLQNNLQVQKRTFIYDVLSGVVQRILEIKHQLCKLDASNYHFFGRGLIVHKLTTDEVEFSDIPEKMKRPKHIQTIIEDAIKSAKEKKELLEQEDLEEESIEEEVNNWWDEELIAKNNAKKQLDLLEPKQELSEETLIRREMISVITRQERSRQTVSVLLQQRQKRQMWERELLGLRQPPAKLEIRERAAKFIQKFLRAYFELKRKKIIDCQRDEILGLRMCKKPSDVEKNKSAEITVHRNQLRNRFEDEWRNEYENMKAKCFEKRAIIAEDYRDHIRHWFRTWYDGAIFFYDIPPEKQGGSTLILKDEIPSPSEWLEEYKIFVEKSKSKKSENTLDQRLAAKQEAKRLKKEEHIKKRMEEAVLRKMMKNPKMHPGYHYPRSYKIGNLVMALENYHKHWDDLDLCETLDVKERFLKTVDESQIWKEIKLEIRPIVDVEMRRELQVLRIALKKDYEENEEEMPVMMPQPKPRKGRKQKKPKAIKHDKLLENMEDLVLKGIVQEYPRKTFKHFIGDPNFVGEDFRAELQPTVPYAAETRSMWWERCREMTQGFHRLLLVGPKESGKTTLIQIMAGLNDAMLFQLDPTWFFEEGTSYLHALVDAVAYCARAVQPSVIYIKHVHRLFYRKVPPEEPALDTKLLIRFLIKQLYKRIQKTDNITVVGSCLDPWLTKSAAMLKQFPTVVMMPTTSYSVTVQLLKKWVLDNRAVPPELEVEGLAHVLKGYRFGYLQEALNRFLSPTRIVKIAASGLFPEELYSFILEDEDENETQVEYHKYLKWYTDKTHWGKLEAKHIAGQKEFRELEQKYLEKVQKKKKQQSVPASIVSSR